MPVFTYKPDAVCHPGEHIQEYLGHYKLTVSDIVLKAKVPRSTQEKMTNEINRVIMGEASITNAIAYILNQGLYMPVTWWLKLQENYDKHLSNKKQG